MTKKNTAATIITIIVAVLALATTLFLLYKMSQSEIDNTSGGFVPSEEISEEMETNATILVKNNYEVFKVFLYRGLPHQEEPYNNVPEDGLYEVKDENYKTMADLEKLVKSTFVEKEAERILTDANGNGPVYSEKTNDSDEKVIGLNADMVDKYDRFAGIDYAYTWENAKFMLTPKSNTECNITIELAAKTDDSSDSSSEVSSDSSEASVSSASSASSDVSSDSSADAASSADESSSDDSTAKKLNAVMLKVNGEWRLQKLVY